MSPLNATTYSEAANQFIAQVNGLQSINDSKEVGLYGMKELKQLGISAFTADFGLQWFDYLAGYDGVFTEFGWNNSRPLQVAMVRGAATVQQKQWGIIITWEYMQSPYIEDGQKLLNDLMYAYNEGAQYLIVFNYPQNVSQYGILKEEHFVALKQFWNYVHTKPPSLDKVQAAIVLPQNYGWGFMSPNDRVWGIWPKDAAAQQVTETILYHINRVGANMDIVYNDTRFDLKQYYDQLFFVSSS
ncbi:MAG: hypothetical protein M1490_05355 [Candidatus Bathyarchaeota archaeon]|nr:hypothetical protein [Candidatus Bathyarchaeota archaeon]